MSVSYHGRERRIHQVFVTRNTEYHIRKQECIGVRDRRSGEWLRGHLALKSAVSGGLTFHSTGSIKASDKLPTVGESLFLSGVSSDVVTSAIIAVKRPVKETVATYPRD